MKTINLTQGKFTLVSDQRYEYLSQWKWFAHRNLSGKWYAVRNEGKFPFQKKIFMHRIITNAPKGMDVDHIDTNGLNNQDENLRVCTRSENQFNRGIQKNNTSGYKGVYWNNACNKYQALIIVNGERMNLGFYKTAEEAARIYDRAAKKYRNKFAQLNFE